MTDDLTAAIEYMSSDDSIYGGGFVEYRTHAEVVLAAVKTLTAERDRLQQEMTENEGVIAVWRGRTERAEAERDRLRAACEYVRRWLDEYDTGHELHPSLRQKLDAALKQQ